MLALKGSSAACYGVCDHSCCRDESASSNINVGRFGFNVTLTKQERRERCHDATADHRNCSEVLSFHNALRKRYSAQQVIIQIWISSHFGLLSKRLFPVDEKVLFIDRDFSRCPSPCKAKSELFWLAVAQAVVRGCLTSAHDRAVWSHARCDAAGGHRNIGSL